MQNNIYQVNFLTNDKFKIFRGLYSDFISKAISDYHFELAPLSYEEFIDAVSTDTIKCVILLENNIPTAFLVYVTAISESVELNLIHCLGDEDLVTKRNILMEFFMEHTKTERENAVVCYPMLGSQTDYASDITNFEFKLLGLIVLRFAMNDSLSTMIYDNIELPEQSDKYKIVSWDNKYFDDIANVIHETFQDTSDALFDTRFTSLEGTKDILAKITDSIYGDFLPDASSILLFEDKPVGYALANETGSKIANIPLVGILEEHRGKGLSVNILYRVLNNIIGLVKSKEKQYFEINVTTETDNFGALKMYRTVGFREDYSYTQAYLPVK